MFHINNLNQIKPCKASSPERCPFNGTGHFESESVAITVLENDLYAKVDSITQIDKSRILELNQTSDGEYLQPTENPKYFVRDLKAVIDKASEGRTSSDLRGARILTAMKSAEFSTKYTLRRAFDKRGQRWEISYRGRLNELKEFTVIAEYPHRDYAQKKEEIFKSLREDFGRNSYGTYDEKAEKAARREVDTLFRSMDYVNEAVEPMNIAKAQEGYLYKEFITAPGELKGQTRYENWFDGDDVRRLLKMSNKGYGKFAKVDLRIYDESQREQPTFWAFRHYHNKWYFECFVDGKIGAKEIHDPDEAYDVVSRFIQKNHRRKGERIEKAEWAKKFMIDSDEAIREYNESVAKMTVDMDAERKEKENSKKLYGEEKESGFMNKVMRLFN